MVCETQVSQDQEHVPMASVLNRPPKMEAVVNLAVDVGYQEFFPLQLIGHLGHWCGRELAAMMIHSTGCAQWGGYAYEEARQG